MSLLDIDAIEACANAATPGRWYVCGNDSLRVHTDLVKSTAQCVTEADAEFIAHAREDVPALIAECRTLRDVIASVYFACLNGYGNDAMSRARDALGDYIEEYGRRNGEIGGKE